jgi:hypothetical protein
MMRAHRAEQVLASVHQPGEARYVEQSGCAFQGVDRAKYFVDQPRVGRITLELQQAGRGAFQMFPGFRDEAFEQCRHRLDVPVNSRAISARSLGRTGLVR